MSVTAAQGFVAAGVRAGIRKTARDLAVVRSAAPAVGCFAPAPWAHGRASDSWMCQRIATKSFSSYFGGHCCKGFGSHKG